MCDSTSPYPLAPFPRWEKGEIDERDIKFNYQINGSILSYARDMRKRPTKAEEHLWQLLRKDQLGGHFRRQHPVCGYIIDFYCNSAKLGIEIDGEIHNDRIQQEKDAQRTSKLNEGGIEIIRFTNNEVMNQTDRVLQKIRSYLPLSQRGRD